MPMTPSIKLISTDFDGTLFAEFENPPVPWALQERLGRLQQAGVKWIINTGRDLSSLLEALGRAHLGIKPDFLVIVEREIYCHRDSQYVECREWNRACTLAHAELFQRIRPDIARLSAWISQRFTATVYEDNYSPFCLIAEKSRDADAIHAYLEDYCRGVPQLAVVRNDVYARFSHQAFNKGSALKEIAAQLQIPPRQTFAAGDHFNDLPMLLAEHAHWLAAPDNAIEPVKKAVRAANGFVSELPHGRGVLQGLEFCLERARGL